MSQGQQQPRHQEPTHERDRYTGLTLLESYEISALVFHAMTGYMAPGKDESAAANSGHTSEQRLAAWQVWSATYGECVRSVLHAHKEIMCPDED